MQKKEILYNELKRDPDNENKKLEYTNYLKCLSKTIKEAKFKYEKNQVDKKCNKARDLWKFINAKLGKKK